MGESETARVNIEVRQDRKDRWKDAVENSGSHRTLSSLVRTAVENEIGDSQQPVQQSPAVDDEKLTQVASNVDRITNRLQGMERQLTRIEDRQEASGPSYSLRRVVNLLLPEPPSEEAVKDGETSGLNFDEWATTPEQFAEKIGADTEEVRAILEDMAETTSMVKHRNLSPGGEPPKDYYWKRG
jgi:hypothetical protein